MLPSMAIDFFPLSLQFVRSVEGGWSNDRRDRGGATQFGISDARDGVIDGMTDTDGDGRPDTRIADLTEAQAAAIYRRDYWDAGRCGEMGPVAALLLFDSLVQHRPRTAAGLLQASVGADPYGVIGPKTLAAALRREATARERLLIEFLGRRAALYRDLSLQPSQAAFFRGWMNRLFLLQQFILREVIGNGR